jgi:hypothetical protein
MACVLPRGEEALLMPVIDADTHVDETEDTWTFGRPEEQALMPTTAFPPNLDPNRPPIRYWLIDGRRQLRFLRDDEKTGTTVAARELLDVDVRLRHMDDLGIDIQVIYPTLFLVEFTERPEVELALRRSYNRWLADRCARSRGRLRWVIVPPLMSMDAALEELRFGKDHGACGVLKKGDREVGRWPNDEYFFPLYEEAERLGLPICIHQGAGTPDFSPARTFSSGVFYRLLLPVLHAFLVLVMHSVPQRFPRLRWGFIEAGASWLPFLFYELRRRREKLVDPTQAIGTPPYEVPDDLLRANRFWVTCQVDEDLPSIIKLAGDTQLLVGSDYTHRDASTELDFVQRLQARGDLTPEQVRRITYDNPKAFYGL